MNVIFLPTPIDRENSELTKYAGGEQLQGDCSGNTARDMVRPMSRADKRLTVCNIYCIGPNVQRILKERLRKNMLFPHRELTSGNRYPIEPAPLNNSKIISIVFFFEPKDQA
jgi:hypothetical protein